MSSVANQTNNPQFKAIDYFCGGGGMTCGLRRAGILKTLEMQTMQDIEQFLQYVIKPNDA